MTSEATFRTGGHQLRSELDSDVADVGLAVYVPREARRKARATFLGSSAEEHAAGRAAERAKALLRSSLRARNCPAHRRGPIEPTSFRQAGVTVTW